MLLRGAFQSKRPKFGKIRGEKSQLCPFTGLSCNFFVTRHACRKFLEQVLHYIQSTNIFFHINNFFSCEQCHITISSLMDIYIYIYIYIYIHNIYISISISLYIYIITQVRNENTKFSSLKFHALRQSSVKRYNV